MKKVSSEVNLLIEKCDPDPFRSPKNLVGNFQIAAREIAEHITWLQKEQSYLLTSAQKEF